MTTPPKAPPAQTDVREVAASAVLSCPPTNKLQTLTKRADFLRAARARYKPMPGFVLQARQRQPDEPASHIRVGFTCSKKVGNAVARNRAKRRLREIARLILPDHGRDGWDYVLIGRRDKTAAYPFDQLQADLRSALAGMHE